MRTGEGIGVSRGFRADIQGLRAVAVGLVVLAHAGVPGMGGGFVGVDVFFVISGFLITGHLLESLRTRGRIGFAEFYARRARRILPAALVVLVLTVAAALVLVPPLRIAEILKDAAATAVYLPNLRFTLLQTDYLAGTAPSPFQHYWSLGVEEQFYLLWPVLLFAVFLLRRRWMIAAVASVIATVAVLSFAACLIVAQVSQPLAFFSLPTRAWELAVGALLAAGVPVLRRLPPRLAAIGGWLGLVALVAGAVGLAADTAYPGVATLAPVLGAAAIIGFGVVRHRFSVQLLLGIRPMQFLGRISYSLYLVHWPLLVLVHERIGLAHPLPLWLGILLGALSIPLGFALYAGVETRFRQPGVGQPGVGQPPNRRSLQWAIAVPVVLAILATAGVPVVDRMPLHSNRTVAATPITAPPTSPNFVPSGVSPTLAAATADTGSLYSSGCQQTLDGSTLLDCSFGNKASPFVIALFGDSHAGRWFSALELVAQQQNVRLETYTKSRCRSEETEKLWNNSANPSCSRWRSAAIAHFAADPPDLIVLTNHLGPTGRDSATATADWERAAESTLARLPAASRVVTIADTPQFATSPVVCLSAHLNNVAACSVARALALNPAIEAAQRIVAAQRAVSTVSATGFIDLDDYLCTATSCPPIIGSTLVYSDEHHLTATFSRKLAPALELALKPYLPPA